MRQVGRDMNIVAALNRLDSRLAAMERLLEMRLGLVNDEAPEPTSGLLERFRTAEGHSAADGDLDNEALVP